MAGIAQKFVLEVLFVYLIWKYMQCFFEQTQVSKKRTAFIYLIFGMLSWISDLNTSYVWGNIMLSVIELFGLALCYRSGFGKKCMAAILIFLNVFFIENVLAIWFGEGQALVHNGIIPITILEFLLKDILLACSVFLVFRFRKLKYLVAIPKLILIGCFMGSVVFIGSEIILIEMNGEKNIFLTANIIYILIIVFGIMHIMDLTARTFTEKMEKERLEQERLYYKENAVVLQKQEEEIRKFRHDIKNHLIAIEELARKHDDEKLFSYLHCYNQKLDEIKMYSDSGNILMDSLINYKLSLASEKGVRVTQRIIVPEKLQIKDEDLVVILGNLLDNAIEALEYIQVGKELHMEMQFFKEKLYIRISNTYDTVFKKEKGGWKTRKQDERCHGFGLKNVQDVVRQYGGTMEVNTKEQWFYVRIVL